MKKIQLTLTEQEAEVLGVKAARLGYNLSKYIKLLLGREVIESFGENAVPVFKMSAGAEKTVEEAMDEYCRGKAVKLKSLDDLDKI